MWNYQDPTQTPSLDIQGFDVEAFDGGIGKVDKATSETDAAHLVVDTGPWIFGRKVVVPAGLVDRVDFDAKRIYVDLTKEEIKNSPELSEGGVVDQDYRDKLGTYFGPFVR